MNDIRAAFDSRAFAGAGFIAATITTIADRLAALGAAENVMHIKAPTIALLLCLVVAALSTQAPTEDTMPVKRIARWCGLTMFAALSLWVTCGGANVLSYNGIPPDMVPAAAAIEDVPQQWWPPPTPGALPNADE